MITVREVEDRDIPHLAEFLPHGFEHTNSRFWLHRFDLWWAQNPAWTPKIPRGWVLDDGTRLVGFIGNFRRGNELQIIPKASRRNGGWLLCARLQ